MAPSKLKARLRGRDGLHLGRRGFLRGEVHRACGLGRRLHLAIGVQIQKRGAGLGDGADGADINFACRLLPALAHLPGPPPPPPPRPLHSPPPPPPPPPAPPP